MIKRHRVTVRKHTKGQSDHVDAWLMSYADMITLLFMLFAIFVSFTLSKKHDATTESALGEPEHPTMTSNHFGLLKTSTPADEAYRALTSVILANSADTQIAVEKKTHSVEVDMSVPFFFQRDTADILEEQIPLLKSLAATINRTAPKDATIEVEAFTDDEGLQSSKLNSWELTGLQAARVASVLAEAGIPSEHLRATSHAGNEPVVPNFDETGKPISENRLRNQRVIIKVEVPDVAPAAELKTLSMNMN